MSALSSGDEKLLQTTCGTPNYVAPEVLKEKGYSGMTADVWSCGVILYVMLAGYLPFEDRTMAGLFQKIEAGKFFFPDHFSKDVKQLISQMLVVDPNKRVTVKQIMENKWFKTGYKRDTMSHAQLKISDGMLANAIETTNEHSVSAEGTKPQQAAPVVTSLNAFDLASKLMAGAINPLMSGVKIRRETRFIATGNAETVRSELNERLTKMNANPSERNNEIKCFVNMSGGMLTFTITVDSTAGGFSLVEVRRGRGRILDFNQVYRTLLNELGQIVSSTEIAN